MTIEKYRILTCILSLLLILSVSVGVHYKRQDDAQIERLQYDLKESNESIELFVGLLKANTHEFDELNDAYSRLLEVTEPKQSSLGPVNSINFEATAYTDGGVTASGFSTIGHTWDSARIIATDPSVIPTGSQVYVEFPEPFAQHNGTYTASDTGGAIKGHIIDIFVGHGEDNLAMSFGRRQVKVTIL